MVTLCQPPHLPPSWGCCLFQAWRSRFGVAGAILFLRQGAEQGGGVGCGGGPGGLGLCVLRYVVKKQRLQTPSPPTNKNRVPLFLGGFWVGKRSFFFWMPSFERMLKEKKMLIDSEDCLMKGNPGDTEKLVDDRLRFFMNASWIKRWPSTL